MRKWSPGFFWVGIGLILVGGVLTIVQIVSGGVSPVAVLSKVALVALGVAFVWQSARNGRRRQ